MKEEVYAVGPYIHYWLDTRVRQGYKDKCGQVLPSGTIMAP